MQNPVTPSELLIKLAKEAITQKAIVEVLRPQILAVQTQFLVENEFYKCPTLCDGKTERILEPSHMYMVRDEQCEDMYLALDLKYRAVGYKLPDEPGYCPLLMAEKLERDAYMAMNEQAIKELAPPEKQVTLKSIWRNQDLKKLTDLNLKYILQFMK
jgi:hypothetical protein